MRLAVGQMTATNDVEANFDTCTALVKDAKAHGADLLSLPECFAFIGESASELLAFMRKVDDPLIDRYRDLAKTHKLWLSLGGLQEHGGERAYNAHLIVDDQGNLRAHYRKLHLFDVDIPGGPRLMESASTGGGTELVVTDSPVGKLGLTICYDLRFAEQYIALRKRGAEVILTPAAFTATTGKAHWEVLLRARAIESQCYVGAAAQYGRHNNKRNSHGEAMIVDPWGAVIARCSDGTGIAVADIFLEHVASVRQKMPVMDHRRPDVYGGIA